MMIVLHELKINNPEEKQQEVHKTKGEMPKRQEEERRERFTGRSPV